MGYKYDWKYGFLRETGNISIDINPRHANAYLDGLKIGDNSLLSSLNINQTMPIRLKNITPHTYNLRIAAPGYHEWEKEIEVSNRQTVYIKEIELLKDNEPEQLVKGKFSSLSLAPSGAYLMYTTINDNQTKVILRDTAQNTNVIVLTLPGTKPPVVVWAKKNNYAILYQGSLPLKNIYIINAEKSETTFLFNAPNAETITAVGWHQNIDPELYYSTPSSLFVYHPALKQQTLLAANTFVDWYIEDGELWTLETNTTTRETKIFKDALGFKNSFAIISDAGNLQAWDILYVHNNHLLLKNTAEADYRLVRPDKQFTIAANHFTISPYNNWWLMWSPSELWTYSENNEPHLLNRSADEIKNVAPLDRYNTLAISSANKTIALFPYYLVRHSLLTNSTNFSAIDPEAHLLYYLDKNALWRLTY